jgi:hemerythrin-like domain-containing protein
MECMDNIMSGIAKKVKDTLEDVKDKAVDSSENTREKAEEYTKRTESDLTREYESKEPMSPAKISEHEPTTVKREHTVNTVYFSRRC